MLSLRHVNGWPRFFVPLAVALVTLGAWTEAAAEAVCRAWRWAGERRMEDDKEVSA
jgi:hypothetical protein